MDQRGITRGGLLYGLVLLALTSCAGEQPATTGTTDIATSSTSIVPITVAPQTTTSLSEDEAAARSLWESLQRVGYRDSWAESPKGAFYQGQPPHAELLTTYLNPAADQAFKTTAGTVPPGAVIVKENYTRERVLLEVDVMVKRDPGYDSAHHDWFWASFSPSGEVDAAGKVAGCFSCHAAAESNDLIFTSPIAPLDIVSNQGPGDQAIARRLWGEMLDADYRETWDVVPGKGRLYRGQTPHSKILTTYLNPQAVEGLRARAGQMPDGSVIVKENYSVEHAILDITVMYKRAGYNPAYGDWLWITFSPAGDALAAGRLGGCINCHGAMRSNDFVTTFPVAGGP